MIHKNIVSAGLMLLIILGIFGGYLYENHLVKELKLAIQSEQELNSRQVKRVLSYYHKFSEEEIRKAVCELGAGSITE